MQAAQNNKRLTTNPRGTPVPIETSCLCILCDVLPMQVYEFVAVPRQPFITVEEIPASESPTSVTMVGQMVSHIRFERCSGLGPMNCTSDTINCM